MKSWLVVLLVGCHLCSGPLLAQKMARIDFLELKSGSSDSSFLIADQDSIVLLADQILKEKHDEGYLEAFWEVKSESDTIQYHLILGDKYSWKQLEKTDTLEFQLAGAHAYPLPYSYPYDQMEAWISYQEQRGFPFAQASIQVTQMEVGYLYGRLQLDLGPLITWDSVKVEGNTRTKQNYLQRISGIIPGTPFSQDNYEKAVKKVGANPYFIWESPPQLQFRTRQAVPVFSLKDRRINVFDGIVGFLPNANEPGRLLVTGQVDLRLFHLGGKGREAGIQWQKLNQQSQSLDMRFKERFVLGSPLDIEANFSLLKQDSSFVNRSFGVDFGLQISELSYLTFFHKRQSGDLIGVGADEGELQDLIDFRWNHYGLKWDWSSLDQLDSPRKGSRIRSQFSVGNKRIIENTGIPEEAYEGVDKSSPQFQTTFGIEKNLFVNPRYGIWLNWAGGHIGNKNLFLNELFRLGGLKSIRGFYETFFFAQTYSYLNMEHRLYLDSRSYLMVFSDAGVLRNPFASPELDRPFSIGTGINLDTGQGLFSFVLALGKSNTQPMSFTYSRVHFGYLARF